MILKEEENFHQDILDRSNSLAQVANLGLEFLWERYRFPDGCRTSPSTADWLSNQWYPKLQNTHQRRRVDTVATRTIRNSVLDVHDNDIRAGKAPFAVRCDRSPR